MNYVLPTEYIGGQWARPSDEEPEAVVVFTTTPSPETGDVGWCWWALGGMGSAESYMDARVQAEAAVVRRRARGAAR